MGEVLLVYAFNLAVLDEPVVARGDEALHTIDYSNVSLDGGEPEGSS